MKNMLKHLLAAMVMMALIATPLSLSVVNNETEAAAPSLPGAAQLMTFHLSGTFAAATYTGIIDMAMPYNARILYIQIVVAAKGGTQGTSTLQFKNGTNTLTGAQDLSGTAATVLEPALTAAQQSIAKDAILSADMVISGGSSPTLSNITVVVAYQRRT